MLKITTSDLIQGGRFQDLINSLPTNSTVEFDLSEIEELGSNAEQGLRILFSHAKNLGNRLKAKNYIEKVFSVISQFIESESNDPVYSSCQPSPYSDIPSGIRKPDSSTGH